MDDFIKVMKALSDPKRVAILKILQHRNMCVCEMQEALGLAQPAVSTHLKILEKAGLVKHFKDGLWVNYYISDGNGSRFAESLLRDLRTWLDDDAGVSGIVKRLPGIRRETIRGTKTQTEM